MAPPTALVMAPSEDALTKAPDETALTDADFDLDMRVFEDTLLTRPGRCETNDGCGSTCSTSACSTSSYDPA